MKRESGWYWVKTSKTAEWKPAWLRYDRCWMVATRDSAYESLGGGKG